MLFIVDLDTARSVLINKGLTALLIPASFEDGPLLETYTVRRLTLLTASILANGVCMKREDVKRQLLHEKQRW